jgi:hypothetical protein
VTVFHLLEIIPCFSRGGGERVSFKRMTWWVNPVIDLLLVPSLMKISNLPLEYTAESNLQYQAVWEELDPFSRFLHSRFPVSGNQLFSDTCSYLLVELIWALPWRNSPFYHPIEDCHIRLF